MAAIRRAFCSLLSRRPVRDLFDRDICWREDSGLAVSNALEVSADLKVSTALKVSTDLGSSLAASIRLRPSPACTETEARMETQTKAEIRMNLRMRCLPCLMKGDYGSGSNRYVILITLSGDMRGKGQ